MTLRLAAETHALSTARTELREQAAVLVWFDDWWLELPGSADEVDVAVSDFLMEDCRRVGGIEGRSHWALTDQVRRRTFRTLGPVGIRRALDSKKNVPEDEVQRAFARAVNPGHHPNVEVTADSIAADLQVGRWLEGVLPDLRPVEELESELELHQLIAPLRSFSADGFYGRKRELELLAEHLEDDRGMSLVISGVGGVGKSTLIARFVTDAIDRSTGLRFAYLNFDRGALAANQPTQLLAEIISQVVLQEPGARQAAAPLIDDLRAHEAVGLQAAAVSSQKATQTIGTSVSDDLLRIAAGFLDSTLKSQLLVVLDTFEEVQRQRITDLFVLWDFLGQLRKMLPKIRVVISGRALDDDLDAGALSRFIELTELDDPAAMHMLMEAQGVRASAELARRTIDLVSRNPLSLRLAIEILRKSDHDEPLLDLELQEGQIQGQLYRRILMHIEDPDVRKMAHPGLVVRVVTRDVIRHVLARPCGIDVPDDDTAERLFSELDREATLVRSDGTSLRHRSDVRKLMLPSLERDQGPQVDAIHRAAVRYYKTLVGPFARAEELYHRMMLDQTERTLDKYWDYDVLPSLLESIDELPPSGRVYLWARSKGEIKLEPDVVRAADDRSWARATESIAVAELRAGRPKLALEIVRERRGSDGESLLPSTEVEALEALRDLDAALKILQTARAVALRKKRSADAVAFTLDLVRVLEKAHRFEEAIHEACQLRDALTAGQGESALDYLIVTTSYLRLLRRSGRQDSDEYGMAAADAVEKAERVPRRELASRAGLLRELLAEVGGASKDLLHFGIENVGVARGRTDRLDSELVLVDESVVDKSTDEPDLDTDDGDPPAYADVYESRSSTGRKVSHYADAVGMGDGLTDAIQESYQSETDELYS